MTEHTYRFGATPDDRCALCESRDCDHRSYSKAYVRFVQAHREAFDAAYLDGNAQASRNELERLEREWKTMLPRHDCTCRPEHCYECGRIAQKRREKVDGFSEDVAIEIGRTSPVHAPMPMALLLDVNAGYA